MPTTTLKSGRVESDPGRGNVAAISQRPQKKRNFAPSMRGRGHQRGSRGRSRHQGNNKRPRDPDQPLYFTKQWLENAITDPWADIRKTWPEFELIVAREERQRAPHFNQWRPPPPGWKPPPPPEPASVSERADRGNEDETDELGKMADEAIHDRPWH